MELKKVLSQRYSSRAYSSRPIEDANLQAVLDAACLAPTAANRQPFQLIVIHTKGREEELQRIYAREWFTEAPIIIGAIGLPQEAWTRFDGQQYTLVDVAIAMDHLILAAADLGLGTCWIAAFDPEEAREILGLPDDVVPIVFTPLGYPADEPKPKVRKNILDLVRYEHW